MSSLLILVHFPPQTLAIYSREKKNLTSSLENQSDLSWQNAVI